MKLISFAFFGPSHGESKYCGNWTRRTYEHKETVLHIDRHDIHKDRYVAVFIPSDSGWWCAGTFSASADSLRSWTGIERKAELMVDQWIEQFGTKGKQDELLSV